MGRMTVLVIEDSNDAEGGWAISLNENRDIYILQRLATRFRSLPPCSSSTSIASRTEPPGGCALALGEFGALRKVDRDERSRSRLLNDGVPATAFATVDRVEDGVMDATAGRSNSPNSAYEGEEASSAIAACRRFAPIKLFIVLSCVQPSFSSDLTVVGSRNGCG